MKEIDEMNEQEVIDEITSLTIELEVVKKTFTREEDYEYAYEYSIDRLFDLRIALHNFLHLIGGKE